MRTLILLRHAKSDYPPGVVDHDRPLAPRGRREAALAGEWIGAHCPAVDEILCSTAVRTRQTAERTGLSAPTRYARTVYEAWPQRILDEIVLTATDVDTLLVVGHAPGVPALALALAGEESDPQAVAGVAGRFPTSALAVLEVPGQWADLTEGAAVLRTFHLARD